MNRELRVLPDVESLAAAAAEAIAAARPRRLGLGGGRLAGVVLRALARTPLVWNAMDLFWCDERCVAPDHPDSNFGAAIANLLQPLSVRPEHAHRIRGEDGPLAAAASYDAELRRAAPEGLDVAWLGMGEDGHTASLFPGSPALGESSRWAAPAEAPDGGARVTMTPAFLNKSGLAVIVVAGAAKAESARQALEEPSAGLPIQRLGPARALWLLDATAASRLSR